VYVSNLPWATTWNQLKDHFQKCGEVTFATVFIDRETGKPKGSGIVEFTTVQAAQQALNTLNGSTFGDRSILVRPARPPTAPGEGSGATPAPGSRPPRRFPRNNADDHSGVGGPSSQQQSQS